MELAYSSEQLRDLCTDPAKHKDCLSDYEAVWLMKRLSDMRAAESCLELIVGSIHMFLRGSIEACKYTIGENISIIFIPNHITIPIGKNGKLDWGKVTRVQIVKLICKGKCYE